jgi:hypothetical protein
MLNVGICLLTMYCFLCILIIKRINKKIREIIHQQPNVGINYYE